MGGFTFVLTLLAALGSGLIGGVFFAFSAFVMKALARLRPDQGIAAMQSINVTVLNRWFLAPFFGTAAACIVLALSSLAVRRDPAALFRLVGSGLYLAGTMLATVYFGWHFVVDDVAGVLLAYLAVLLARLMIYPGSRRAPWRLVDGVSRDRATGPVSEPVSGPGKP